MAGAKLSFDTRKPITIGVQIDDRLPTKLKTPPVRPKRRTGASVDTSDHVIDASPLPKKATARKNITHGVESVKLAPIIDVEIKRPRMMGSLRARPTVAPRRIRKSDSTPEHSTPTNAARKGTDARKPDLMKSMPRYFTR
ncbi:hypothetical protein G6F35_017638 [Rhizopus arrhizus]|nr:hypothetical protein G6F35_017638 [Rhizopus arrhizus]